MRPSSRLASILALALAMLVAHPARGAQPQPEPATPPPVQASDPAPASPEPTPTGEAAPATDTSPQPGWDAPQPAQPVYQPQQPQPYSQPAPAPKRARRRGRGLLIAGWVVFGVIYLASAVNGAAAVDCANRSCGSFIDDEDTDREAIDDRRRQWGLRMLIPVAGPFAAIPVSRTGLSAAWAGVLGLLQVTGATLGIVGAVQFSQSGRELSLHFLPAGQGGMLAGRLRF